MYRYDIRVRLNAFAFRVPNSNNVTNAPPDISQRREDIAATCFAETRRLDEGSFTDNPYAKGGARFGYDWTTGLPRSHNANNSASSVASTSNITDSSNS